MAQQPQPKKNAAYTVVFPILDADGDLVTGAAGLDSEISKDKGAFVDCTNEATEIATSSGMYYLDLTAAEMNGDVIAIIVKTSTVGAKTTPIVLYPGLRNTNELSYHDDPDPSGLLDAAISGVKSQTDKLTFDGANQVAASLGATVRALVADSVLSRAISNVEATAPFRSLAGAIAKLVNRVKIAGTTLTVYKTDDVSPMGSQTIGTDPSANPVVEVNTD